MQTLNYEMTTLDNGIRVITENIQHVQFMCMGVWVAVGSRYESAEENGITHFIEHMLFKGTEKRSAEDISQEIDAVGGQLNAFTSKENTCYYIKALTEHFPLAVDILSDMLQNSKFAEEEIKKEREVIVEEIRMYEDSPDDLVQDLLADHLWPDHPLGRKILGTEESIYRFQHDTLVNYMKRYYTGENIVISVVGNIEHDTVVKAVKNYFGQIPRGTKNQIIAAGKPASGVHCHYKEIGQSQICVAAPGVEKTSPLLYPMSILNTYLGGGMSSRLVKKIREELGLAYAIYSYHGSYFDSGAFVIAAGTRPENCQRVVNIILNEVKDVAEKGITEEELQKSFHQLKGSLYMGLETVNSRMNKLGRSLLLYNKVITAEEDVCALAKVTKEDVQEIAQNIFMNDQFLITVLGPVQELEITNY